MEWLDVIQDLAKWGLLHNEKSFIQLVFSKLVGDGGYKYSGTSWIRNILKPINNKKKKPLKIFRRLFTNVHYTVIQCQSSSKSVLMIMLVFKANESLQKCKHLEWDLRQCSLIWQIFFLFSFLERSYTLDNTLAKREMMKKNECNS